MNKYNIEGLETEPRRNGFTTQKRAWIIGSAIGVVAAAWFMLTGDAMAAGLLGGPCVLKLWAEVKG